MLCLGGNTSMRTFVTETGLTAGRADPNDAEALDSELTPITMITNGCALGELD
jgi:hypothetical protein